MPPDLNIELSGKFGIDRLDRLFYRLAPLFSLQEPAVLNIDLRSLKFLHPSTAAMLAATLATCKTRGLSAPGSTILPPEDANVRAYASRIDLLQSSIGVELEESFTRRESHGFREVKQFVSERESDDVARELTEALVERSDIDGDARNAIFTCLGELCNNVPHHANTEVGGFGVAQGYPSARRFEVAIADLGVGIPASLRENPVFAHVGDDVEAIASALKLGATSKPEGSGHVRAHKGYGLAVTEELLARNGGRLVIRSGQGDVRRGAQNAAKATNVTFPGSLIVIEARTDTPLDISAVYDELLGPPDEDF